MPRAFTCSIRIQTLLRQEEFDETYDEKMFVVQNPPAKPLTQMEMDDIYALPYMRTYHPIYEKDGGVPAIEEVKFSAGQQPWLLWWLQLLCSNFSSGQNYSDQKS